MDILPNIRGSTTTRTIQFTPSMLMLIHSLYAGPVNDTLQPLGSCYVIALNFVYLIRAPITIELPYHFLAARSESQAQHTGNGLSSCLGIVNPRNSLNDSWLLH
jgi:hypothetical protein